MLALQCYRFHPPPPPPPFRVVPVTSAYCGAGASADLTEPLVAPDADDEASDDRHASSSGRPAPQADGWPAIGDLQHNGAEWAAFVQSLVVNCVEGCRSLLGARVPKPYAQSTPALSMPLVGCVHVNLRLMWSLISLVEPCTCVARSDHRQLHVAAAAEARQTGPAHPSAGAPTLALQCRPQSVRAPLQARVTQARLQL